MVSLGPFVNSISSYPLSATQRWFHQGFCSSATVGHRWHCSWTWKQWMPSCGFHVHHYDAVQARAKSFHLWPRGRAKHNTGKPLPLIICSILPEGGGGFSRGGVIFQRQCFISGRTKFRSNHWKTSPLSSKNYTLYMISSPGSCSREGVSFRCCCREGELFKWELIAVLQYQVSFLEKSANFCLSFWMFFFFFSQEEVFGVVGRPTVEACMQGYNGTIFA